MRHPHDWLKASRLHTTVDVKLRVSDCLLATGSCGASEKPGPHSIECLAMFWRYANCFSSGSASPGKVQQTLDWWNSKTVEIVQDDMQKYYEYAINGVEGYEDKCFGKS